MSKTYTMLTAFLFVAFFGPSKAAPPDSIDTVYIDGLPCNPACQSYMSWSRALMAPKPVPTIASRPDQRAQQTPTVAARRTAKTRGAPPKVAGGRMAVKSAARIKVPRGQRLSRPAMVPAPSDRVTSSPVTGPAPDSEVETKNEQTATTPPQDPAPTSLPPDKATEGNVAIPDPQTAASSSDIAAQLPSEERIAILLVQPNIKSAADLTNKVIAIDGLQSSSIADIRDAIIATGAADVQLSASESLALLRIVNGEVPAAVVDLVTPTAAKRWSGETRGFNILRIPLPAASERSDRG